MNNKYKWNLSSVRWLCMTPCLCVIFLLGAGRVNATSGQQAERINLSFESAEIRIVLDEIKVQTGFDFVYNARDINDRVKVTVKLQNADIQTALKACLEKVNVDFLIRDKIIVLQKRDGANTAPQEVRVLKGKVVDRNGSPLPGVSVMLKGTAIGVATDVDGHFSIVVPKSVKVTELLFSFIGMQTELYPVKDDKEIRIVMKESNEALDEVIVTGMETIRKDRMTGSATVITAKDLQMQGVTSIDRILEGRVAGLNSTTVSGAPGTRSKITIRGENNLSGDTEPLWIVDGLPMLSGVPTNTSGDYAGTIMQDGVGNIMPDDIESISILKDASAAAIYGARAANGVIVITTKKGFRSKTVINYNGTYNCGIAPRNRIDFMNTDEKLRYERSIIDNFGMNYATNAGRGGFLLKRKAEGYLSESEYNEQYNQLSKINTDWFKVLFRAAQSQSHSISLRGGTEELTYYTAVNFQRQNGILISNQYENAGVLMKLDYRPVKNLILAFNISANARKNKDHASVVNPFNYAVFANPYERPYDEEGNYAPDLSYLPGNYTGERASGYKYDTFNILREMKETKSKQTGLDAELTFDIRYEVIPGLTLESIVRKGVSYNTGSSEINAGTYASWQHENIARKVYDQQLLPDEFNNGDLSESSGKNHSWSIRNQIDYSFTIKKDHLFSILVANEVMSKKFNNFGYTAPIYYADYRITGMTKFDNDVLYEKIRDELAKMYHTKAGQDRSVSFLGSLRYGYKDRYILNFNYRADGADVIGNTNRFTPLWSVGVRYNLHNEKFFQNAVVNQLAIRASYGYTGNIDRSALPFSTIGHGSDMYEGNRFVTKYTFPNPTVKWEKKRDRNIGLELSLFHSRVNFTAEYYSNRTKDVLEYLEVPASTGRSRVSANGGIVENSGYEFYLNVKWVDAKDFTFNTSVNLARNKNVIKKSRYSYNSFAEVLAAGDTYGGQVNIIGKETGSIYGWKFAGVNPRTGNPQFYLTEEGKRAYSVFLDEWGTLDDYFKDMYKNSISSFNSIPDKVDFIRERGELMPYMEPSMTYLGCLNPKFVGGFSTTMRYKGIEFSTYWTFKTGHMIPNFDEYANAPGSGDIGISNTNRERKFLYYWQTPGDITEIPRFVPNGDRWSSFVTSDRYSKGDYLRMTNLSVSYRFPRHITEMLRMSTLTIGFNARNLLTFTKYKGLDVGTQGAFTYPASRDFNFKLTVGF